ncbi:hypothetical protein Tcan_06137 [Toxocara canis]|uniref:Uncharacterized protein n=1 Tax=Toxocara canis TaxID=6265 RepID=A0A0B2V6J1_TOXCA|nr:hypothetical protein Tcan_06137 [Toxocara canis]
MFESAFSGIEVGDRLATNGVPNSTPVVPSSLSLRFLSLCGGIMLSGGIWTFDFEATSDAESASFDRHRGNPKDCRGSVGFASAACSTNNQFGNNGSKRKLMCKVLWRCATVI